MPAFGTADPTGWPAWTDGSCAQRSGQLAIVIVNWNTAALLRLSLVANCAGGGGHPVIYVVDNGSTDVSAERWWLADSPACH